MYPPSIPCILAVWTVLCDFVHGQSPPRPEHPRPDRFRENWVTLNGEWQFEIDEQADGESRGLCHGQPLESRIIVPFCPESRLSGLDLGNTKKLKNVWYRRTFELPASMKDKRIRIHFGAVDHQAWVFINRRFAGTHVGCSASFHFEITDLLTEGENEVVVKVRDDQWSGLQPRGKQSNGKSYNVFYTRTTGIWQSVWLEALGQAFIEDISVVPDPDNSRVLVQATINGGGEDLVLKAEAFADGRPVGVDTAGSPWLNHLVVDLSETKLWEPGKPFLYDLKLTLSNGDRRLDELTSYFGLRKIAINGRQVLINDKPVFQRLVLDQGFYPDGIWTAPSDEALKRDIELAMACGFNGARLHQKVFEPRFLYWADKLGYLVWGEYPNAGYDNRREGFAAVVNEWTEILRRDRNHPSIVGWCPFNENSLNREQAAELQQMVWNITKAIDPTRPVLETSGWTHTLLRPELRDAHDYTPEPARLKARWMEFFEAPPAGPFPPIRYFSPAESNADTGVPFMVSEVGGIGWATEGGWAYGEGPKTVDEFHSRYRGTVGAMLDNPNLFGFCYTQLTDIEQEKNGLYYDDRRPKFDVSRLYEITSREAAYEKGGGQAPQPVVKVVDAEWKVLVGAARDGVLSTPYRYVTEQPSGDWRDAEFDAGGWQTGLAPFANDRHQRTEWAGEHIYCRKTFEFDGRALKHAAVVLRNNGRTEIWLNGDKILDAEATRSYRLHMLTDVLREKLRKGSNTLAIHSRKQRRATYLDLAILVDP